jgi:hypothetical protein
VIQLILPFHECADPAPVESIAEPLHFVADSVVAEATADPAVIESAVETLHSTTDPAGSGVALTETFCLCVRV